MEKLKTINEFADELIEHREHPHILVLLQAEMAGVYARKMTDYAEIKIRMAVFWAQTKFPKGKKALSDKAVEFMFMLTDEGKVYTKLKYEAKALEKMMQGASAVSYSATQEAKNLR